MTEVKLCGLTRPEDIAVANGLAVEYIGFVFAKSRRQVTPRQAEALKAGLDPTIQAVGVFVNAKMELIGWLVDQQVIDVIQLHGQEDEVYIQALRKRCPHTPIWKAVTVTAQVAFTQWPSADRFVLDNGAGGTGAVFDWSLLPTLTIPKPYFIAGGLNPDNVTQVLGYGPCGVDVSGGVETQGVKDPEKMKEFTQKVRQYR